MFCYVTMPFGLRNAGAAYQQCMQIVFGDHIGRTIEAYEDNIVVTTRRRMTWLRTCTPHSIACGPTG
jgi:hypothetical protein